MNLAGYSDIKKLTEGPERVIYTGLRESDQKPVLLKALRSEHPSADLIALMYHEYEVCKDLHLPGILQTYDLIDQQNQYTLIQEDMQGISLHDYLQKNPLNDLALFLKLAIQMTQILGELHQHHVIHKDIKPANFIIHPDTLTEKLTDFNFASKLLHEVQDVVPPNKLEGTLAYMAPEQTGRMNMNIDYRSDFYALGVTFYEMLTGELPFLYNDPLELLHAHLANPIPDLSSGKFTIPIMLAKVVQKLMAKNPRDRYQSAIGLQADLERCQNELENTGKIEAFLLGENDVFDRLNLSQKLYGREEEAKLLLAAYDRVSQGAVEGLMVCGYSGIGKTMLINEVHKPMVKQKGYFISGKFDQLQRNTPYTAITQAFNQLARLILAEPEHRFEQIKKEILNALGGVAQVIIDLAPDLELIIGAQPALEKISAQETQNRMMTFFKRFLKVIASGDHPLVLFIDDLQWVDSGSLKLLEYVLTDDELSHILLIGAYRDNEVDEIHPLRQFLNNMEAQRKAIHTLSLGPLTTEHFEDLFKDSFNREALVIKPFAELVHKRTEGNPFFCKQVINTLYREKLLYFDYDHRQWDWNLEGITQLKITDNVVDLMLSKLQELPLETQNLLKYAACLGNRFTIESLMLVSGQSGDAIGKTLWAALQQELILTLRLGYKRMEAMRHENLAALLSKDITYQFVHDRVQQAVYQGISKEEKEHMHLSIARLIIEKEPETSQKERLFEVTDHFNQAHRLLTEIEKIKVANLNYQAGLRALNANAYVPMSKYLFSGLSLIDENGWDGQYELLFNLNREYAMSLYLRGQLEESASLSKNLLSRAKSILDIVSVYRMQCLLQQAAGDMPEALETMLKALDLLDVKIPRNPSYLQVYMKSLLVKQEMRRYNISNLEKELKICTDEKIFVAMKLLHEAFFFTYWSHTSLYLYISIVAMQLMLRHGRTTAAASSLTFYCFTLLYLHRNVDECFELWGAVERLLQIEVDKYASADSYYVRAYIFNHLRYPPENARSYYSQALQDGLESGNLIVAAISMYALYYLPARTKSKRECIQTYGIVIDFCRKIHLHDQADLAQLRFQMMSEDDVSNSSENLFKKISSGKNIPYKVFSSMMMVDKLFFLESYEQAVTYHLSWFVYEAWVFIHDETWDHETIGALSIMKYLPHLPYFKRFPYFRNFRKIYKNLKFASKINPDDYLHQYLILSGVKAQSEGAFEKALIFFQKASENAKKRDFSLWAAMANEYAGDLLATRGYARAAIDYIRDAHYYYDRYGVFSKVKILENRYPSCFSARTEIDVSTQMKGATQLHSTTTTTTSASLDFMSVIKASQTISGEIILDKLFEKMLHIVIENAGAEKALFLERNNNTWIVTASLLVRKGEKEFKMLNASLNEFQDVPQTVIQYALRAKEPVVLNHAAEDSQYRQDPYIMRFEPKSVLCLPVLHQDKVLGVIYLENNLTIGAFTQDRITVLTTLASQIAISLENSHYLQRMERLYRSTERFVPKAFLSLMKKETIEEIKVGDSVEVNLATMFADIRNFTTISEALGTEKTAFLLNSYMQKMSPIIRRNHGFVSQFFGDGIMALFPRENVDAVNAAVEMRKALVEFETMIREKGYDPVEIGIGINAGSAMLITLGEEERIDSSVVSDVVNSAARIEGLNKFYGTGLLISDAVYETIQDPLNYFIRIVDKVKVKGKKRAMLIYEVMVLSQDEDASQARDYINAFQSAFVLYERGEFKEALAAFNACLSIRPNDSVAPILQRRCQTFLTEGTPKDWDGTYAALEK
jgi:predicted ATPase/class 3 adenylate cyclase